MIKSKQKVQRQRRVRGKIIGTTETPRLSVFRSNNHMYAQLIDDVSKKTLFGMSEKHLTKKEGTKTTIAKLLGTEIAKKAVEKKITKVMFDRGSYRYHGRVKALAEGAREGGLQF
ncbi:MAG TPA: 50S ribosomal protein L18 [Candidatus Saccharimonadales bacterium]|nr:50S ribosomal protein L18 [Candidatus Saccharimonadales bacterium]